MPEFYSMPI